jgi:hypothetical protein
MVGRDDAILQCLSSIYGRALHVARDPKGSAKISNLLGRKMVNAGREGIFSVAITGFDP